MIQLTARGDQEGSAPSTHALEGRHTALTDVFERLIQILELLDAALNRLKQRDKESTSKRIQAFRAASRA